jgi:cell wall-associated NlpC family hydrolase
MRSALPAIAGAVLVALVPAGDALAAPYASRTLREGKTGKDVRVLQRYLDRSGQTTHADGEFGPATVRSLRAFEASKDKRVDGLASRTDQRLVRRAAKGSAGLDATGGALPPAASPLVSAPAGVATIGADGRAVAPASAPKAVRQIIAAGNRIADKPYAYGGGHGSFRAPGYDCSGSVSYVLHAAGLLDAPLDSSGLMSFGSPGRGAWVTVRANAGHAYLLVAGVRFDTSGAQGRGSRWTATKTTASGFTARHPQGL